MKTLHGLRIHRRPSLLAEACDRTSQRAVLVEAERIEIVLNHLRTNVEDRKLDFGMEVQVE